jgi:hypothetical protein
MLALIAGVTIVAGAPTPAYAAKKTPTEVERTQLRKQEEGGLKELDENYATQAEAQAEYYKKLANEVKKSGGNAQPLLDAAAYFDSEANAVGRIRP